MRPAQPLTRLLGVVLVGGVSVTVLAADPELKLDRVWLEAGGFFDGSRADSRQYGNAAASMHWQVDPHWEVRLGGRVDGYWQTGDPDFTGATPDYTENVVSWRPHGNLAAVATIEPLKDGIDVSVVGEGMEMMGAASVLYPALYLKDIVMANVIVIVLGFFASLSPAWRASRYDPIRAITKV